MTHYYDIKLETIAVVHSETKQGVYENVSNTLDKLANTFGAIAPIEHATEILMQANNNTFNVVVSFDTTCVSDFDKPTFREKFEDALYNFNWDFALNLRVVEV